MDGALRFPVAGCIAYAAPIAFATSKGGLRSGLPTYFVSTIVSSFALTQAPGLGRDALMINVIVQAVLLMIALLIVDRSRQDRESSQEKATLDDLTGAKNRTAIKEQGLKALNQSIAKGEPMVLAMIDLDKFKQLNDRYGHAFGDAALRDLVATLKANLGRGALIGRTGGDEFVVILPSCSPESARHRLDSAYDAYSDRTLVAGYPNTFTYGIAVPGPNGFSWSGLLDAADQDMYSRKTSRKAHLLRSA